MPKRKKPVRRTPRRSPYERSLEHATHRLDKALREQMDCQAKLEALNREIPYLQGVIRALTPVATNGTVATSSDGKIWTYSSPQVLPPIMPTVPGHLKRFIKPVDNGIVVDQSEPFIPDIIPGEELLP